MKLEPYLSDEIIPDLNNIVRDIEDEGDRCYFGSTNDADRLREIADWLEANFRRTPPASQSDEALVEGDAPDEITALKTQLAGAWKEVERQEHLAKVYRQAQLTAEQKLCREQDNAAGWRGRAKHLEAREAAARAEGRREGAVILKGIGKINGDGFKDTTKVGEVVFVWNKELPSPYAPGLYPRVGNEVWAASREQYDFQPATVAEVQTILHRVRREGIEEAAEYLDQFSPKLVESAAAIRALKGERT